MLWENGSIGVLGRQTKADQRVL